MRLSLFNDDVRQRECEFNFSVSYPNLPPVRKSVSSDDLSLRRRFGQVAGAAGFRNRQNAPMLWVCTAF